MKVILLCKRRPQGKDLWLRPNGRFFHLAKHLAELGHEVDLVLLNYRREEEFTCRRDGLVWHSVNLLPDPLRFYRYCRRLAKMTRPDWVGGFSDTYFGILAVVLASRCSARSLVDAYDNYESYLPWCKPLHWLWRMALRQADVLSAPGLHLLRRMAQGGEPGQVHVVLPMAADGQFKPHDRLQARQQLGLPADKKLVGYCGSADNTRDIATFLAAVCQLSATHPNYAFVMTGKLQPGMALPAAVLHLGYLPDAQMPLMVGALDVMVAVNHPSAFGSFSYPVKICEALASGVPVIATQTPSVAELLGDDAALLVPPGDAAALASRLEQLLEGRLACHLPLPEGWPAIASRLEACLRKG